MIKIIELRKVILTALRAVTNNIYFQSAPTDAVYPYIVYDLPNSIDDGSMERFILDVDGWDISAETAALETLMDNIDKQLHRKTFTVLNDLSMTFYRDNRLALTDDDPRIRRRKYIYQVRTFERRTLNG